MNGLSDVFGFDHARQNCFVIANSSQNPVELCGGGHSAAPGDIWLIFKDDYVSGVSSSNSKVKVLAKFGAKSQLLKS